MLGGRCFLAVCGVSVPVCKGWLWQEGMQLRGCCLLSGWSGTVPHSTPCKRGGPGLCIGRDMQGLPAAAAGVHSLLIMPCCAPGRAC